MIASATHIQPAAPMRPEVPADLLVSASSPSGTDVSRLIREAENAQSPRARLAQWWSRAPRWRSLNGLSFDAVSRPSDVVVGVAPQPLSEMQADGQLARMVPAHHVVSGSEVEVAGILARKLSSDRGGQSFP